MTKHHTQSGFAHALLLLPLALVIIIAAVGFYVFTASPKVDENNLPQFITANPVDLKDYIGLSKYRSGAGHDFADSYETCRSMKHYFMPKAEDTARITEDPAKIPQTIDPATNIPILSPVDGTITKIQSEQHPLGKQIFIQPSAAKEFSIRMFHIYPLDSIQKGTTVKAGQRIGSVLPYQQFDIAVEARKLAKFKMVSYFDVMNDQVFADYQAKGISNRDQAIISKETRDSQPLECRGEEFAQQSDGGDTDWIYFEGEMSPKERYEQQRQNSSIPQTTGQPTPAMTR